MIATLAGGVGGPGKATLVAVPACGVASAPGSLYAGDGSSVRKVSQTGWLTTPAGTGTSAPLGEAGPAAAASLSGACGVAIDHSGNLVIAGAGNERARVVAARTGSFYGRAMTAGHIYTVAGNGTFGSSGDSSPATSAETGGPDGVAVDGAGNLLIADMVNNRVRVMAASNGTFYGRAMTAGDIYTVAGKGQLGFSGDGGQAIAATLDRPFAVAADQSGALMIADTGNNRIREVTG